MNDEIDWDWQRITLTNELADLHGDAFENRFQEIAKAAWGEDFTPTIPMGRRGDLKCDGYRHSTRTVFQCFGPRYGKADVAEALEKIDEDFRGAVAAWKNPDMLEWVFVQNLYRNKVPSEIVRRVEQLSSELGIPGRLWARDELVHLARSIPAAQRATLFGRAPVASDMVRVTYERIGIALAVLKRELSTSPLGAVTLPAAVDEKMEWNALPPSARHFIGIGLSGAEQVRQYLMDTVEPEEAERMSNGFKLRYVECRRDGLEPERIFQQLTIYAGGGTADTDRDSAALAIVAHFFSTCEIFETPPVEVVR